MIKTRAPYVSSFIFQQVHDKKIMLQTTPSLYIAVTATLGRVNEASVAVMFICYYKPLGGLDIFVKGVKGLLLHSKTRNIQGFSACHPHSRDTLVHNWVKWPGRESDHKT